MSRIGEVITRFEKKGYKLVALKVSGGSSSV
jgi:nucleoside diphosphate kinase